MVLTASTLFITRHHVFVVPPLSAFSIPIGIIFVDGIELFKLRCFILLDIGNEASHLPRRMARSGLLHNCYAKPPAVGAAVYTSSGPILGHSARNRTAVSEYLGIPYAAPPVGRLRFAPPEKYSSSTPFNAASFVSDSRQSTLDGLHS
jgi:hypothetical protein